MRFARNIEQFERERAEITRLLIGAMHEGIRVVRIDGALNESSKSKSYAQEEIERVIKQARKEGDRALIEDFAPEMLALIDKFGNSGQSGGSAPYTAGAIVGALKKLLMQEPISPVTNEDEDWFQPIDETWQNKRCSALFKESKDGRPYYLDAIVWKTPNGATYTGTAYDGAEKIYSRQYVKKFPFEPKTFTIDVEERKIGKDDWAFDIMNTDQLSEVFDYYDKFKQKK